MSKTMHAFLFALLVAVLSTHASASVIPAAGCPDTASTHPFTTMIHQTGDTVPARPEIERPAVVIMGDSADLYLLFSHHFIGFSSKSESPLPGAGKTLLNIR